jgi:hypothetical protein
MNRCEPRLQQNNMNIDSMIVQHPLDTFSFTGKMESLDSTGQKAADQLLTMIGDFRFLKDDIRGTCAGYFLLVDLLWFPHLCFLAHINCEKLRDYLWRGDGRNREELQELFDDQQTVLPFPAKERQVIPLSGCASGGKSLCTATPVAEFPTGQTKRAVGQPSNNSSECGPQARQSGKAEMTIDLTRDAESAL